MTVAWSPADVARFQAAGYSLVPNRAGEMIWQFTGTAAQRMNITGSPARQAEGQYAPPPIRDVPLSERVAAIRESGLYDRYGNYVNPNYQAAFEREFQQQYGARPPVAQAQVQEAQAAYAREYSKVAVPNPLDPLGYYKEVAYLPGRPALNLETLGMTGYGADVGEQIIGSIAGQHLLPEQVAVLEKNPIIVSREREKYYAGVSGGTAKLLGGGNVSFVGEAPFGSTVTSDIKTALGLGGSTTVITPVAARITEKAFATGGEYGIYDSGGKLLAGASYKYPDKTLFEQPSKPDVSGSWVFSEVPLLNVFTQLNTGQSVSVAWGGTAPKDFIPVTGTSGLYSTPPQKVEINKQELTIKLPISQPAASDSIPEGIMKTLGYGKGGIWEKQRGTFPGFVTEVGANLVGDIYGGTQFTMNVFGGGATATKAVEVTKGFRQLPTFEGYKETIFAPLTYASQHPEQGIVAIEMAAIPFIGDTGAFLKAAGLSSGVMYGLDVLGGRQKEAPADVAAVIFSTPATMQIGGLIGRGLGANPMDTSALGSWKSVTATAATGGVGGVLFAGTQDVQKGLPFDVQKAEVYGLVGTAFGAALGAVSVGQTRGEFPTARLFRAPYEKVIPGGAGEEPAVKQGAYVGISIEQGGKPRLIAGLMDLKPSVGVPSIEPEGLLISNVNIQPSLIEHKGGFNPTQAEIYKSWGEEQINYFKTIAPEPVKDLFNLGAEQFTSESREQADAFAKYIKQSSTFSLKERVGWGDWAGQQKGYTPEFKMTLDEALATSDRFANPDVRQAVIDVLKEDNALLRGGVVEKMVLGKEKLTPLHDIDPIVANPTATANKIISRVGTIPDVEAKLSGTSLVEIKMGEEFVHLVDIHGANEAPDLSGLFESRSQGNKYFGWGWTQQPTITSPEGFKVISPATQTQLMVGSMTSPQEYGGYSPVGYRFKDVGKALEDVVGMAKDIGNPVIVGQVREFQSTLSPDVLAGTYAPKNILLQLGGGETGVAPSFGAEITGGVGLGGSVFTAPSADIQKALPITVPSGRYISSSSLSDIGSSSSGIIEFPRASYNVPTVSALQPSPSGKATSGSSIFPSYFKSDIISIGSGSPSAYKSNPLSNIISSGSASSSAGSLISSIGSSFSGGSQYSGGSGSSRSSSSSSSSSSPSPSQSPSQSPSYSPSSSSESRYSSVSWFPEFMGSDLKEKGPMKSKILGEIKGITRGAPLPWADILSVLRTQARTGGRSHQPLINTANLERWTRAAGEGFMRGFPTQEMVENKVKASGLGFLGGRKAGEDLFSRKKKVRLFD